MSERDYAPLSIACVRGLCDKIYEKRKFAGGEIEKMVKDFSDANNTSQIRRLIKVLGQDLMSSTNPNVKNGALMGLSSVAVGLGKGCTEYMTELIHPIIACFSESESRVRYQAAEALFNVVKIARGASLAHFPIIFDALARLAADSEPQVKQAAELLDRLVKDIVSESSGLEAGALVSLVRARLYARGAAARQFVAAWVAVLDAVPGLDLLPHLPQLLDGLFLMLDDPAPEIRRMVEVQLGEFLRSIRQQPERAHFQQMLNILITHAMASDELTQLTAITWLKEFVEVCGRGVLPQLSGVLAAVLPCLAYTDEPRKSIRETAATVNLQLTKLVGEYCHSVTRSKPDTQLSAKETTEDKADKVSHTQGSNSTAKESAVPRSGETKGVSDAKGSGSSATDALPPRSGEPKDGHTLAPNSEAVEGAATAEGSDTAVSKEDEQLNLDAVVAVLTQMLHRSSVHTKVAALDWILHLYNKLPDEMYVETDSVFVCVVGSLTDASDDVVRRALAVLAEICSCAPHAGDLESSPYYYKFLQALLRLLAADENLLEDRGAFIIRQLCVLLAAEDVYRALARILAAERNLRFAATAVSVLASILLTAAELYDLRARLRTATDQSTRELIVCLYRCWSHAPVALLALCLLTHHYAHCNQLIATFGDLEITVDFLTEVDKLVQLIESPIFAYLRLELLGGAGSAALRGALYGVLMLLPQGDAFHALRRRLQAAPPDRCLPQAACESQGAVPEAELRELLAEFRRVQAAHRQHRALDRPRRPDC